MLAHPLIAAAKRVLSDAQANERGGLWPGRDVDCMDLRVSKACLSRALNIMAALLHILENEGCKVRVEKCEKESTAAMIYGEAIRFGLVERSRQVKLAPAAAVKPGVSNSYFDNSITLEPTGRLSIEVWNFYSGSLQKAWRDRQSASLEEQLSKCAAGMIRIALFERAERDAKAKKRQKLRRNESTR
jgi:hypothetical protein